MSIDKKIDAERSDIEGTPVQTPHSFNESEVELVKRVNGMYTTTRSGKEDTSSAQIAMERQKRSESLRNASIGLTCLLGATALADYADIIDPDAIFYAVNVASIYITDSRSRTEAKKVKHSTNYMKENKPTNRSGKTSTILEKKSGQREHT